MDFVGDEDAIRYALEVAIREHESSGVLVPLDSLPAANVARVFLAELDRRGWIIRLERKP